MIKAVVFDLDDTLYLEQDYVFSGFKAVALLIQDDFSLPADTVSSKLKELFSQDRSLVFNRMLSHYALAHDQRYIQQLVELYRKHHPNIKLQEDAVNLLIWLKEKNLKLGIITDGYAVTQRKKIEALQIAPLFDEIIVTDELGRENWKPSLLPYQLMSTSLGVGYSAMAYIGDNPSKDFVTANKMGMTTVQITREANVYRDIAVEEHYRARHIVYDLTEIQKLLFTTE